MHACLFLMFGHTYKTYDKNPTFLHSSRPFVHAQCTLLNPKSELAPRGDGAGKQMKIESQSEVREEWFLLMWVNLGSPLGWGC